MNDPEMHSLFMRAARLTPEADGGGSNDAELVMTAIRERPEVADVVLAVDARVKALMEAGWAGAAASGTSRRSSVC